MLGAEQKKISNLYDIKKANIMGGAGLPYKSPLERYIFTHHWSKIFMIINCLEAKRTQEHRSPRVKDRWQGMKEERLVEINMYLLHACLFLHSPPLIRNQVPFGEATLTLFCHLHHICLMLCGAVQLEVRLNSPLTLGKFHLLKKNGLGYQSTSIQ